MEEKMALATKALGVVFALSVWPGIPTALYYDKYKTKHAIEQTELASAHAGDVNTNNFYEQAHLNSILAHLAGHGEKHFFQGPTIVELFPPSREYLNGWKGKDLVVHFHDQITSPEGEDIIAKLDINDTTVDLHVVRSDYDQTRFVNPYIYPHLGAVMQVVKEGFKSANSDNVQIAYSSERGVIEIGAPSAHTSQAAHKSVASLNL